MLVSVSIWLSASVSRDSSVVLCVISQSTSLTNEAWLGYIRGTSEDKVWGTVAFSAKYNIIELVLFRLRDRAGSLTSPCGVSAGSGNGRWMMTM